jgi:hypothetical protein
MYFKSQRAGGDIVLQGMHEFHKEPVSSKTNDPCGPHLQELLGRLGQESFSGLPSSVSHGEPQLAGVGREVPCGWMQAAFQRWEMDMGRGQVFNKSRCFPTSQSWKLGLVLGTQARDILFSSISRCWSCHWRFITLLQQGLAGLVEAGPASCIVSDAVSRRWYSLPPSVHQPLWGCYVFQAPIILVGVVW